MKQILLFVALILISVLARADVFRCKTQDGVVYSEHPCANAKDVTVVSNLAKKPSEEDVRAAESRLDSNIRQVEEHDRQDRLARESRQGSPVVGVVVMTRPTSTATRPFVHNQNLHFQQSPQTSSKSTDRVLK